MCWYSFHAILPCGAYKSLELMTASSSKDKTLWHEGQWAGSIVCGKEGAVETTCCNHHTSKNYPGKTSKWKWVCSFPRAGAFA